MGTSNNVQTKGALLLLLDNLSGRRRRAWGGGLVLLALDSAELFGVGENEVHVLPGVNR